MNLPSNHATRGLLYSLAVAMLCAFLAPGLVKAQVPMPRIDPYELYQMAKEDLEEGRTAHALEKLKRGLAEGVGERELEWTYRLAVAVTYDQMGKPVAALEATRRFVMALDAVGAMLTETWRGRREGMRERALDLEARILETFGALDVHSEPGGARIHIDGAPAGVDGDLRTPFVLYLMPGRHELRLDLPGHVSGTASVDIVPGRVLTPRLALEREVLKSSLLVETGADDAVVLVDGRRVGTGEHVSLELEPGTKSVRVEREGHEAFEEDVVLQADSASATVLRVSWSDESAGALGAMDEAVNGDALAPRRRALDPLWGWIAGGSGLAVLLAGLPLSLMAMSDQDSLSGYQYELPTEENQAAFDDLKTSMQTKEIAAGVLYGVGGAAVIGGAVWLMLSYNQDVTRPGDEPSLSLHVTPLPGGAAMSLGGRW